MIGNKFSHSPLTKRNQVWLELFLLDVAFWKALPVLIECLLYILY